MFPVTQPCTDYHQGCWRILYDEHETSAVVELDRVRMRRCFVDFETGLRTRRTDSVLMGRQTEHAQPGNWSIIVSPVQPMRDAAQQCPERTPGTDEPLRGDVMVIHGTLPCPMPDLARSLLLPEMDQRKWATVGSTSLVAYTSNAIFSVIFWNKPSPGPEGSQNTNSGEQLFVDHGGHASRR